MSVQYLTNDKGEKTSVLVPLNEWDKLIREREQLNRKLQEAELALRFKKTLTDAKLFKDGKLKTSPLKELLNEL